MTLLMRVSQKQRRSPYSVQSASLFSNCMFAAKAPSKEFDFEGINFLFIYYKSFDFNMFAQVMEYICLRIQLS